MEKNTQQLSPKAIDKLKKTGVAKSREDYVKGVKQGTKNILKKSNATTSKSFIFPHSTRQSFVKKGKFVVNDPIFSGGFRRAAGNISKAEYNKLKPYIDRHEADEARYSNKILKKHGSVAGVQKIYKGFNQVGQHKSLGVLKKEKELTDFANKLYGDAEALRKLRKDSGEYDLVKNLSDKKINKMDKEIAKKSISKLRSDLLEEVKNGKISKAEFLRKLKIINKLRRNMPRIVKYSKGAVAVAGIGTGVIAGRKLWKNHLNKKEQNLKSKSKK